MIGFVRYTCNKKNVPVMRNECEKCSEYNPCAKDGKWCFAGALIAEHDLSCSECTMPLMENADAPILRDIATVTINLGSGMEVDVLREDIKEKLKRDFYKASGLMFGA